MIKGETVILYEKNQIGVDPFDKPIYGADVEVEIKNVVIGSPSFDDAVAELNLTGKRLAFTLGIPKGDTHNWKDSEVLIRGQKFKTYGFPLKQTDENVPGPWNLQVKVEAYE